MSQSTPSKVPPKRCLDAFWEVEQGKASNPSLLQIALTKEHTLHRCISLADMDKNEKFPKPGAFDKHSLSFFVEGPGLPDLDMPQIIRENSSKYIGAVKINAQVVLDKEKAGFADLQLVHDPFPDPDGNQHQNHSRLICTKSMTVCKEIQRQMKLAGWSVEPIPDKIG